MLVRPFIFSTNVGRFLWHWWVRRKHLNEGWAVGVRGISKNEVRRLIFTTLCVLVLYLPLSLYRFAVFISNGKLLPYRWSIIHGPGWSIIIYQRLDKIPWSGWIGVALAFTSFALVGFTRNARRMYETWVECVYDHMPTRFQLKLGGMRKISERCKERRAAKSVTNGEIQGYRSDITLGYFT